MRKSRLAAISMLCALMLLPVLALAEEKPGAPLDWWYHSSLASDNIPNNLLSHFELKYIHHEATGNSEGFQYTGAAKLILRKHIVSSITAYEISKSKTTIFVGGANTTRNNKQNAKETLIVDITKALSIHAGAIYHTDLKRYIDSRYTVFSGFQYNLATHARYLLSLGVFVGHDETAYMNDELQKLVPYVYVPDYESGVIQVAQSFRWKVRDNVMLSESVKYLSFFDDAEYERWDVNLAADVAVTKHISLTVGYELHYDDNVFAEVAKPFGYMKQDTLFSTGIKLEF